MGADAPAATFGAHLRAVRMFFLLPQKNNIRIQRSQASKGFAKGKARFPFALFCFLFQEKKKRPGGEPYKLKTFIRLYDADRRDETKA